MATSAPRRPALPRHLYAISRVRSFALVAYAVGLAVLPALLTATLVSSSMTGAMVPVVAVCMLATVHGGHMLGFLGHEGIHLILHPNRWVSILLGSFLASMTSFPAIGYGVSHWNHHRFTNQLSDPDVLVFPRFRNLCSRILLSRIGANRSYLRYTIRAAIGRHMPVGYKLPFTPPQQRLLARLNLGFIVFWIGLYAGLAWWFPVQMLFAVGIPLLVLFPISGLRAYVEHAGTDVGMYRDSRSYSSPLFTLLFFGNNFHLEHHLYPAVPCYNLPAVHRFLRNGGHFSGRDVHIDGRVSAIVRYLSSAAPYPGALSRDLEHDPFLREVVGK